MLINEINNYFVEDINYELEMVKRVVNLIDLFCWIRLEKEQNIKWIEYGFYLFVIFQSI